MVGKDEKISQEAYDVLSEEMRAMRMDQLASEEVSFKAFIVKAGDQRVRQMEGKQKLRERRKVL